MKKKRISEEPEDFEPTYDRLYEIQDDDISGMLESLAEVMHPIQLTEKRIDSAMEAMNNCKRGTV